MEVEIKPPRWVKDFRCSTRFIFSFNFINYLQLLKLQDLIFVVMVWDLVLEITSTFKYVDLVCVFGYICARVALYKSDGRPSIVVYHLLQIGHFPRPPCYRPM